MSLAQILIRSACGLALIIPGLVLYVGWIDMRVRMQRVWRIVLTFAFAWYVVIVMTVTGITTPSGFAFAFLSFTEGSTWLQALRGLLVFVPLGLFLPVLYKYFNRLDRTMAAGFILALLIELVRVFGMGPLNFLLLLAAPFGSGIGFLLYRLARLRWRKSPVWRRFRSRGVNPLFETGLIVLYDLIIMMSLQPWLVHTLFPSF